MSGLRKREPRNLYYTPRIGISVEERQRFHEFLTVCLYFLPNSCRKVRNLLQCTILQESSSQSCTLSVER